MPKKRSPATPCEHRNIDTLGAKFGHELCDYDADLATGTDGRLALRFGDAVARIQAKGTREQLGEQVRGTG